MRPAAVLLALVTCALAAGCGGSGSATAGERSAAGAAPPPPGSLEALWRGPGPAVAIVAGTSDYAPGRNRISFLVVDKQSRLVTTPTARVWVARGLREQPFARATARSVRIGVPGGAEAEVGELYVAYLSLPAPGRYWLLAKPVGGRSIQALGTLELGRRSAAPSVGERAIASRTPTLASTGGDLERLTTASPPDRELLRVSVAQALAAKRPFVVTFATPLYCQTRACGPVVDVVRSVARRYRGAGMDFIHVEIYEGNDPAKGVNRWVSQWRLPTEPFTFVVDRAGIIRAKLEGAFSAGELAEAVERVLGR
jgi:hypothetical protein